MELWVQKTFVCLLFILFPILFGLVLPYFSMRKHLRNRTLPRWYGPVNSMSIGLLFGVLLLHLIPDAFEDTNAALEALHLSTVYPLSSLLIGTGFFLVTLVEVMVSAHNGESHDCDNMFEHSTSVNGIYTMVFGLSAHSLFEGLAVGLQSSAADVWTLTIVIMIHKCLFALIMGISALRTLTLTQSAICLFIFAISSSAGVAIGTIIEAISSESPKMDLTVGVLESISTGTFVFVVFMELVPKGMDLHAQDALKTVVLVMIGFGIMAGFQALDLISS
ncbi:unnamed protein product [Oikopleura dioica]|uniref:Uncharacterized protein n=1 Tax=Oikopleura dioica TaxID=34765 RepID=E4XEP5_OIKDI|nr:unnamed protein product [Oikopleura dioica]